MDLARIAIGVVGPKPQANRKLSKLLNPSSVIAWLINWSRPDTQPPCVVPPYPPAGATWWISGPLRSPRGLRRDPRFDTAQSAKRIGNIRKDETPSLHGLFLQQAEEGAWVRLASLESARITPRLTSLARNWPSLEAFFTAVMVKCEDATLRAARLSLLHRLRQSFASLISASGSDRLAWVSTNQSTPNETTPFPPLFSNGIVRLWKTRWEPIAPDVWAIEDTAGKARWCSGKVPHRE